ncbi:MAG: sialidase family protein, partial [Bacteroidota bacterium]|nr:sialidase family protein [Bacteroidota bacterium]
AADGRLKRSPDGGLTWTASDAGIHAGPISAFCFPENGDYFAGTWAAGIHRSTNAGASWSLTDSVFIPFSTKELRATATSGIFALTYDNGLLRSTDDGAHWTPLARVTDSTAIAAFALSNGMLLAGDNLGDIFRSTDEGASWEQLSTLEATSGSVNIAAMREDNSDDMTVYAATDRGFYRSSDGGRTWTTQLINGINRALQTLHQTEDGTLYCAGIRALYRSTDRGTTWSGSYVSSSLPWRGHVTSNSRSQVLLSGGKDVFYSSDGSGNWERIPLDEDITALGVDRNGYLLVGTAHAGVFRSTASTLSAGGSAPLPATLSIEAVYPQPLRAHADISARISLSEAASVTLRVYDVTGALRLEERRGTMHPGTQVVTLASPGLTPGSYLLELGTPRGRSARCFIVLR